MNKYVVNGINFNPNQKNRTSPFMKILAAIFTFIGIVLLVLALLAGGALFGGLILWLLWNLLIVNLFDVQTFSYWQCVGVSLVLSIIGGYFRNSSSNSK